MTKSKFVVQLNIGSKDQIQKAITNNQYLKNKIQDELYATLSVKKHSELKLLKPSLKKWCLNTDDKMFLEVSDNKLFLNQLKSVNELIHFLNSDDIETLNSAIKFSSDNIDVSDLVEDLKKCYLDSYKKEMDQIYDIDILVEYITNDINNGVKYYYNNKNHSIDIYK